MPRPNVRFRLIDQSLVVPVTEGFSNTVGAVYNPTNSLKVLGNTAEKENNYYFVPSLEDWYSRLNNYIIGQVNGITFLDGITAYSLGSCAGSYINGTYTGSGISAGFTLEWWPIQNFLQYGAGCYVGFGNGLDGITGIKDASFDVIFQGGRSGIAGSQYANAVTTIVDYKDTTETPCIGVVYVPSSTLSITTAPSVPSGTNSKNYIRVYGEKIHLDSNGENTIETSLVADVAGCLARTDREAYPWFSPAGSSRGRILNVLRLKRTLTVSEQDVLYENNINPVVTFAGEGTLLFGDKTGDSSSSTLSRINVSRLFMYVKKALAPVARSVLFEQNDSNTRSRFVLAAEGFLDRIVAQNGITEYKVICDTSNNTPEIVEANYFVADILIKPITSVNFVTITLTNADISSTI